MEFQSCFHHNSGAQKSFVCLHKQSGVSSRHSFAVITQRNCVGVFFLFFFSLRMPRSSHKPLELRQPLRPEKSISLISSERVMSRPFSEALLTRSSLPQVRSLTKLRLSCAPMRARPLSSLIQMTPGSRGAQHGSLSVALRRVSLLRMAKVCPRSLASIHMHTNLQPVTMIFRCDPSFLTFSYVLCPDQLPRGRYAILHKHTGNSVSVIYEC